MNQLSKQKHTRNRQIMQPKKHKKMTRWYELFLLTVPSFPLNIQTNTIALDVVKWRGGGYNQQITASI